MRPACVCSGSGNGCGYGSTPTATSSSSRSRPCRTRSSDGPEREQPRSTRAGLPTGRPALDEAQRLAVFFAGARFVVLFFAALALDVVFFAALFVVLFAADFVPVVRRVVVPPAFFAALRAAFAAFDGPDAAVRAVLRAVVAVDLAAALVAASATLPSLTAPLTTPLNCEPGRNFGTDVFFTLTASPVRGLRPVRAARSTFSKTPKPVMATFSPWATARWMVSSTASTALSAVRFSTPSLVRIASMSSALFTNVPPMTSRPALDLLGGT